MACLDAEGGQAGGAVEPALAKGTFEWASAFSNTGLSPALAWFIAFECKLFINRFIACAGWPIEYRFIACAR